MIEYANTGRFKVNIGAMRSLAAATGMELRTLVDLAERDELGKVLYRGGPTYQSPGAPIVGREKCTGSGDPHAVQESLARRRIGP